MADWEHLLRILTLPQTSCSALSVPEQYNLLCKWDWGVYRLEEEQEKGEPTATVMREAFRLQYQEAMKRVGEQEGE
jgi:hypothetical protein